MATATSAPKLTHDYRGKKDNKNAVKSTDGAGNVYSYKPGKAEREGRKRVFDRFSAMRDDSKRKEAEKAWDLGDKMYQMWAPERDPEDWRADVVLPDGFSAIQTHLQETIDLRPRPQLEGVEESDAKLEQYNNHIFQHAMDVTEFDVETHKARQCTAIRGTAFTLEEYRYETREVQYPEDFKKGEIVYKKKEIVDFDDVYTRFVDNWSVYNDPGAEDAKYRNDCIYREVLDHDTFMSLYDGKHGFKNISEVVPAGSLDPKAGFFKKADDITNKDVEILHYWNKITDSYDVLANNVLIRQGPMMSRHKQLPIDVWNFYPVLGSIYGMGIPQIIYTLVEERRSNRNIQLDRGKLHNSKMFLVNDLFDLDEDDLTPRPHGLVKVNTNGLPLNQAIMPLEYGDVPSSSIRMDETLKEDERRAHGMSELPAESTGGTAFEAAVIKESTQKRINLINTLTNMQTLVCLGQKKWSNIQFFYPYGRQERVFENNKWHEKTVYRTVKVDGLEYKVIGDPDKGEKVEMKATKIPGKSRLKLDDTYSGYMDGQFDIIVSAAANTVVSKPIKLANMKEMATMAATNPLFMQHANAEGIYEDLIEAADLSKERWLRSGGMSEAEMVTLADQENALFMRMEETGKIFALPGTPNATMMHTLQHINFTETRAFANLSKPVQDAVAKHIADEHENNPQTGSVADLMGTGGGSGGAPAPGGGPEQGGGGNATPIGSPGGPVAPERTVDSGAGVVA